MAHVLARPDSIRQRAQNAATISSAVAAVLVIAAVAQLARDESETWEPWTIALVVLALAGWVASVLLFLDVVTHGVRPHSPRPSGASWSYQPLVDDYEEHSKQLRERLRRAGRASLVALVLTVAAIAAELGEGVHSAEHDRQLVLTEPAASAVAELCGWGRAVPAGDTRLNVRATTKALSKTVVLVTDVSRPVGGRTQPCRGPTERIHLPRSAILATSDR